MRKLSLTPKLLYNRETCEARFGPYSSPDGTIHNIADLILDCKYAVKFGTVLSQQHSSSLGSCFFNWKQNYTQRIQCKMHTKTLLCLFDVLWKPGQSFHLLAKFLFLFTSFTFSHSLLYIALSKDFIRLHTYT